MQQEQQKSIEVDKLGFKKSYEYISKEELERLEIKSEKNEQETEKFWIKFLKRFEGNENNPKMPPRCSELRSLIRLGIPMPLRVKIWMYYSGATELMETYPGFYSLVTNLEREDIRNQNNDKYVNEVFQHIEIVERDLHRTFPENVKFKLPKKPNNNPSNVGPSPHDNRHIALHDSTVYIKSLRNVLVAFAYYSFPHNDPSKSYYHKSKYEVGYCQSLNFIVGMLLLVFSQDVPFEDNLIYRLEVEERVFWMLVALVDNILPLETYGHSLEGSQTDQKVLWNIFIKDFASIWGLDPLAKWMDQVEKGQFIPRRGGRPRSFGGVPPLDTISTQWFLTLYLNSLPIQTVLRVWDCLIYEGYSTLFMVALAILKLNQHNVLSFDEPIESWKWIKDAPKRIFDPDELIRVCYERSADQNVNGIENFKEFHIINQHDIDLQRQNVKNNNSRR